MERFIIEANGPVSGNVSVSGAKNAALPLQAASLLTPENLVLENLPDVADVATMCALLEHLGVSVARGEGVAVLGGGTLCGYVAPYDLVSAMRASILVLGPLLARQGVARISQPGGCAIGKRPIDLHLSALRQMGATIEETEGYIEARSRRLRGTRIAFPKVTVTGTENLMMAATLAEGTTVIENAAREPEVVDLAQCLIAMGARISGHGSNTITIEGVPALHGARHRVMPDRIEAGTWLVAAAITRGEVVVGNLEPSHLGATTALLEQAGVPLEIGPDFVRVKRCGNLKPVHVATRPYPEFATDMQAQLTVLMTTAAGNSRITETIFENRFMHIPELVRMGADIAIEGRTAIVRGPSRLVGQRVTATDLRASASLVLAGLVAEGITVVEKIHHLDRGYAHLEEKLRGLGGSIRRETRRARENDNPVEKEAIAV